jgi:hypothetical protein
MTLLDTVYTHVITSIQHGVQDVRNLKLVGRPPPPVGNSSASPIETSHIDPSLSTQTLPYRCTHLADPHCTAVAGS